MEIFSKEVQFGIIKIQLSVREDENCTVVFTAKDQSDEIIWTAPLKDSEGKIKTYPTASEAFLDAEQRMMTYR